MFRILFLEISFLNHSYSATLQKYQSFSNRSFKHNSVHMPSLNLTSESVFLNLRKIGVEESEGVDEKSDKK